MAHHHLSLVKTITHSLLLTDTMTKELLIAQLRQGTNGNSILQILDALCDGMDSSESSQDNAPTLDEIQF
jgi:hypothetical protein